MTQQEQIRQEQEAQMAAPAKPFGWLAQTISNVFHPLMVLTAVAVVLCNFTHLSFLPAKLQWFFIAEVAFYTLLMPMLVITLLHVFHVIGHWALRDRRDRTLPFLTNFVCYLTCSIVLTRNQFLPDWALMGYYASAILTGVAWIISFWWKISAHASADAAGATFMIYLASWYPEMMPMWLTIAPIVIVGAVCSSRVYLGRHTLAQVTAGVALGIVSMLLAEWLFL